MMTPETRFRFYAHTAAMQLLAFLFVLLSFTSAKAADSPLVHIVVGESMSDSDSHLATDRLQEYGDFTAELVRNSSPEANHRTADLTIILGTPTDMPELQKQWADYPSAKQDSYLIKSISSEPAVVVASGVNQRAVLYAVYHLADLVRAKADLSSLDIFRSPRIGARYVSFGATTYGRRY